MRRPATLAAIEKVYEVSGVVDLALKASERITDEDT
jgi:hypothetical protein